MTETLNGPFHSKITRAESANGISGDKWYPALDPDGRHILGKGRRSEDARRAESRARCDRSRGNRAVEDRQLLDSNDGTGRNEKSHTPGQDTS